MAEGSKQGVADGDRNLDTLWEIHLKWEDRVAEVIDEFERFTREVRQELQTLKMGEGTLLNSDERDVNVFRVAEGRRRELGQFQNIGRQNFRANAEVEEQQRFDPSESDEKGNNPTRELAFKRGRELRYEQCSLTDYRPKIDISLFDGHLHIEDYFDWEQSVENFFNFMEIRSDRQVRLVRAN